LALHGKRDFQVPEDEVGPWRTALAGKAQSRTKSFAGLNHLFVVGSGAPQPFEYYRPAHVDGAVITTITDFVKGPASRSPKCNTGAVEPRG
jgi:hypothetical protein